MPKVSDFDHGRYMTRKDKKRAESIPGMADWIKARSMKKHAFIGEEDYAGKTLGMEGHNKYKIQRRAEEIANEIKARRMKKHASTVKPYKEDPFRTTKTVAEVEAANHGLNLMTDVGAAGVAAAGGFKPLFKVIREKGFKGLKEIGTNHEFREDLKKMLKAQKYILPVGVGITGAYVGKAFYDDIKHKRIKDNFTAEVTGYKINKRASDHSHDKELATFVRVILNDRRPDSKYNQKELSAGIKVEHEHTKSSFIARKIAKDHLDEIPDYYTRLKFLEELAKKQMGEKG